MGPPPTSAQMQAGPPMAGSAPGAYGGMGVSAPPMGGAPMGGGVAAPMGGGAGFQQGGYGQPAGFGQTGPSADARLQQMAADIAQANPAPHFVQGTVAKLPNSVSAKQKAGLPLGVVIQPLAPTPLGLEPVPSISFGAVGTIIRCKECRTYINPFVQWESNGRRWMCNLCGSSQATPDAYYSSLDESGRRADRFDRHELSKGAVEYIAPGEYMVRPPQAPVFMFVIDVSYTAVVTGMLDTVVSGIKEAIQSGRIPGGSRTQVGIITYDTSLHFYNLNPNLSQPQIFVVADLEDIFLPLPDDILVNLSESEAAILNLLDSLPQIYHDTKLNESCMGSAIKGAYLAMKHIGGKLLVFGACIPSVGELSLKSTRDNPHLLGTDREVELLRPVGEGYKGLATELTKVQISVEMFFAPQAYVDLASIAPLAKYTGGDVRYYPQFHIQTTGMKLKTELVHVLTRYMGWEAVMRIRVSRGWKITKFYGHLFIKGADLLVVPNCHADQTFAISLEMEENVTPDPILCVQSALLYTNSDGERRIRVHTWAAVTTQSFQDIVGSASVHATTAMLSQITLEHSLATTLKEGRDKLQAQCQQIVQAGNLCPNAEALQYLPLYIVGMLKSAAFRGTNDVPADMRTYLWMRLDTLAVSQVAAYYVPRMMALHNLPDNVGVPDANGQCILPDTLNLAAECMTQDGVYLLEDGESMFLWMGNAVSPTFLQSCFGCSSSEELDINTAEANLNSRTDALASRVNAVINQVRFERPVPYIQLHVMRHCDQKATRFFASLIEDRTNGLQSTFTEFMQRMGHRPAQQQGQAPPGGPPAMGGMPLAGGYAGGQNMPAMGGASMGGMGGGGGAPPMMGGGGAPPMGGMGGAPPMGGPPMRR